jgi:hypothetical protein
VRGVATEGGAVNAIGLVSPVLTTNCTFSSIGVDALRTKVPCELGSPLAQRRFANVQPLALLADRLDDQMDVGMWFVCV